MLLIQNGTIYTPHEVIDGGAVGIKNGRIVTIAAAQDIGPIGAAEVIDATGKLLVPGFIDLQCNGGFGHDFTADPASIWEAAARLPQYGVTTFLPTIITSSPPGPGNATARSHTTRCIGALCSTAATA